MSQQFPTSIGAQTPTDAGGTRRFLASQQFPTSIGAQTGHRPSQPLPERRSQQFPTSIGAQTPTYRVRMLLTAPVPAVPDFDRCSDKSTLT